MKTNLFSIIKENILIDILTSFHHCTDLPVRLLNESGEELLHIGDTYKFCSIFSSLICPENSCSKIQSQATNMAMTFGNTYIFSCPSNLSSMVFPILNDTTLFGSVIVGPFLMDDPDSLLISSIAEKYNCSIDSLLNLYESINDLKVLKPSLVTHISKLLYYLMSNTLNSTNKNNFLINQEKLTQQSKINEAIQLYKNGSLEITASYPFEKEQELISKIKSADTTEIKRILNELLGYVLFYEGNNLDLIKHRSVELCSLLSRAVIRCGAHSKEILIVNEKFINNLQSINSLDSLCYELQRTVEIFIENMYYKSSTTNHDCIKKAVKYLVSNYSKEITLEEISSYVNLSPSYFSSLFKQVTKSNYKDYLNNIRVEESKLLLVNTNYPIIDIALATGFDDPSYFSKVFKKYTGISPLKYRRSN